MNLTINNSFRNPLCWGKCPANLKEDRVFGLKTKTYFLGGKPGKFLSVTFYFYKWYFFMRNIKVK